MKNLILIIVFISNYNSIIGQEINPFGKLIYKDTLTFNPLHEWISNKDTNLWQIGIPQKNNFNNTFDSLPAIVTRLNENYPKGSNGSFEVKLPYKYNWGEGILTFWHKYDMDSLNDGGIIEVSKDNGSSWKNIIGSTVGIKTIYNGLYTSNDTIIGGTPAFTGQSLSWKKVELYWWWLALTKKSTSDGIILRFRFVSSDDSTNTGGWILSHFEFKGFDVASGINELAKNNGLIYPNPAKDFVKINSKEGNLTIELYDYLGTKINKEINGNNEVDITNLADGIYFYIIKQNGIKIDFGKIIKN